MHAPAAPHAANARMLSATHLIVHNPLETHRVTFYIVSMQHTSTYSTGATKNSAIYRRLLGRRSCTTPGGDAAANVAEPTQGGFHTVINQTNKSGNQRFMLSLCLAPSFFLSYAAWHCTCLNSSEGYMLRGRLGCLSHGNSIDTRAAYFKYSFVSTRRLYIS